MNNKCNIISCTKCDISLRRNNIVNGVGNINSRIVIIGEAPGYYEDKQGIPFVGYSGNLLTYMLDLVGLTRSDVYITNVIKCKPPQNRTPRAIEISNCLPNLVNELTVINPKIIILLGSVALNTYFQRSNLTMNRNTGRIIITKSSNFVLPMYHPSYILRNIKNEKLVRSYVSNFKTLGLLYRYLVNPILQFKI